MNLDNMQIPALGEDQDIIVTIEEGKSFSIKALVDIIIAFINKIIAFEF